MSKYPCISISEKDIKLIKIKIKINNNLFIISSNKINYLLLNVAHLYILVKLLSKIKKTFI